MEETQLPVNIGLWLVSLVPLAAILFLLVVLRWKAASAGPVGYFLAVLAAFFIFETPAQNVGLQTVKGVWDALFIIYVIVPALLLYQVSKEAGAFDAIQRGIESYTPNDLMHVLGFGWVFASFLQGITGFGAPIAVTAPLLVAVGVKPLWAVVIPLIGHAWANTFGTLAVAWEGLNLVADIQDPALTAGIAAAMLLIGNVLAGFSIAWIYGRMAGIREALPAILIIAAIHGIGQLILAPIIPTLSAFVPGTLAIGALLWLARSRWYREDSQVDDSPIMQEGQADETREETELGREESTQDEMPLLLSLAPYLALIVLILLVQLIPPLGDALEQFEVGLPFPPLQTGLGVEIEAEDAYSAFSPLTHPGTFLLVATLIAYFLYNRQDHLGHDALGGIIVRTIRTSIPSAIALLALVPLALVMEGSGQVQVLALGIAAVASGPVYTFFAPAIGALGGFMTASNMSSNILLGPLQDQTASALDLPQSVILAGQTSGAAVVNAMSPANVLLGTGSVGRPGEEGQVIRRTAVYTAIFTMLAGAASLAALFILNGGNGG
jgi:lactate permease